MALPEDAEQPIHGTYDNSELLLDEGKQILYGSEETPAEITQGSLKIAGQEITIERVEGIVKKVTVTGSPAHYQQQLASDQDLISAEGMTIILDYDNQHLSVDEKVQFTQGKNLFTGCHIDYYLDSRRLVTPRCSSGEQAQAILAPKDNPQ